MKTKFNLTKSEQRAHSANLERLKSTGLVTGAENPASCESRLIRIVQSGLGVIHAGTGKGIAFAVCVRLTVLQSGIAICDYDFTIPGCESAKIFLAEISERSHSYRPLGWLDLERDVVLNDLILNGRPLPCDRKLEGFVVAESFDPLSSQFRAGMKIDARICLADQLDRIYTSEVELMVEKRHAQVAHGVDPRKGNGLFAPAMASRNGSVGVSRGSPAVVKSPARSSFEGGFANGIETKPLKSLL